MPNNSISTNDLAPNSIFRVRGKLQFSRLQKFLGQDPARSAEENRKALDADNEKQKSNGRPQHTYPYVTATMSHAKVVCKDGANPTMEEKYAANRMYVSKNPDMAASRGKQFTSDAMAPRPDYKTPWVATMNKNGKLDAVVMKGELAQDLDVTLFVQVYKAARNNGTKLVGVLVNEPVRFYNAGGQDLSQFGLVFNEPANPDESEPEPAAVAAIPEGEDPFSSDGAPAAPGGGIQLPDEDDNVFTSEGGEDDFPV